MNWTISDAKAQLSKDIREAERRYMERVGAIAIINDDLHLTRYAAVRHLREKGMKYREIGERFGFSTVNARTLFLKSQRYFSD